MSAEPESYCPFPSEINRYADHVNEHTITWARSFGLLANERAERRYRASMLGRLSARCYPLADKEPLEIIANWNAWLFLRDDLCDEAGMGHNLRLLNAHSDRLLDVLRGAVPRRSDDPLTVALADLRLRLTRRMDDAWMDRFIMSVKEYFEGSLWEAENRAAGAIPSVEAYKLMRAYTGAVNTAVELIDMSEGISLPLVVRKDPVIQELAGIANNVVCWCNDIFSALKERAHEDCHNLVLIFERREGATPEQATERVLSSVREQISRFLSLEACLPRFGSQLDWQISRYIAVLKAWMRGNIDWSLESGRYQNGATIHEQASPTPASDPQRFGRRSGA